MVIFINDERPYLSWLAHHRCGFVLDARRRVTKKHLTLHRATCSEIRAMKSKRTRWTTGGRLKACSLDIDELATWAREESGAGPAYCPACTPEKEFTALHPCGNSGSRAAAPLTKLGNEILSYVLEVAVIHLDNESAEYKLTVAEIADSLSKSPAQISAALLRLIDDGYLQTVETDVAGAALAGACGIQPTAVALRTVPAFKTLPAQELAREIESLRRKPT